MLTKEDSNGKRLAACGQNIDWGDTPLHLHCCSLHAQAGLSANHPTTFDTVALAAVATISATLSKLR